MYSKYIRKFLLATMDVTKLYHHCEGESCSFCEWHAQNPINIRLLEDTLSANNNAAKANEESVFIVDEEVITVMDSIVEEHKCNSKAYNVVTESSYSGIQPMSGHPALLNECMDHPNCRKTSKDRWNAEYQKRLVTRQSGL